MQAVVLGSINIDEFYLVPHILNKGETLQATGSYKLGGGKGANQSVALARAGIKTSMVGQIGSDGIWLKELLQSHLVHVEHVLVDHHGQTGRAIIQLSTDDNAILLFPGTNLSIDPLRVQKCILSLGLFFLVLQNEINIDCALIAIQSSNSVVCFNPSPFHSGLSPILQSAHVLFVNEIELDQIFKHFNLKSCSESDLFSCLCSLRLLVATKGLDGAQVWFKSKDGKVSFITKEACKVNVLDTTGCGDTFTSFFLSRIMNGSKGSSVFEILESMTRVELLVEALNYGIVASGLACESKGAMSSIPDLTLVQKKLTEIQRDF